MSSFYILNIPAYFRRSCIIVINVNFNWTSFKSCSCFISLSFHLPISPTVDAMVPIASTFLRYASIASFSLATHASRRAFVSASTRSRRYGSVFDLRTLIQPSSYSRR